MIKLKTFLILTALIVTNSVKADQSQISALSKDPQWLALLHVENDTESKIPDPAFFISELKDPLNELTATINSLKSDSDTQCRFPARYEWLASKLPEIAELKKVPCPELETWFSSINPKGATLIFASSYMNNPASAFGHTFLRLDTENSQDLLAYTANYAASTDADNALSYAAKGIFGGYSGFYSVTPYYVKVKEYSDMENRDIWEYRLKLSQNEVRLLTLHLWELKNIAVTYYYFDENCSYKILELLNVAKPELQPQRRFNSWVIPVDTVRFLDNMISNASFRPSAQTILSNKLKHSTEEQKEMAGRIAASEADTSEADALTLDLSYELLNYRRLAGKSDYTLDQLNAKAFEILSARGRLSSDFKVPDVPTPDIRPEEGHNTGQLGVELGRKRDLWFSRFSLRPAFHELTDPAAGYIQGSQINFFKIAFDQTESEGFDLAYFTALDITSITPREEFYSPLSWNVRTGLKRNMIQFRDDSLTAYLGAAAGSSWKISEENIFYALLDSEIRANKHYQSDLNPGIGARSGLLISVNDIINLKPEISWLRFADQTALESDLSLGYALNRQLSIAAGVNYQREYDRNAFISTLGLKWYFNPG